jgi:uncharacterized membrane protein YphA (DoxX/SURF4 family)
MNALVQLVSLAARLFVGAVLIYASYDKAWQPAEFARALAAYEMAPLVLVNPGSVLLAWLELLTGALLVLGMAVRAAALWASGLFTLFIGLMVYAGLTGAGYDCGCFPGGGHEAGFGAAARDLVFLLPALWLVVFPGRWLAAAPGRGSGRRRTRL